MIRPWTTRKTVPLFEFFIKLNCADEKDTFTTFGVTASACMGVSNEYDLYKRVNKRTYFEQTERV